MIFLNLRFFSLVFLFTILGANLSLGTEHDVLHSSSQAEGHALKRYFSAIGDFNEGNSEQAYQSFLTYIEQKADINDLEKDIKPFYLKNVSSIKTQLEEIKEVIGRARQEDVQALETIGTWYLNNTYLNYNQDKGLGFLWKAVSGDSSSARFSFGQILETMFEENNPYHPKFFAEGRHLIEKAAEQDDPEALFYLGRSN